MFSSYFLLILPSLPPLPPPQPKQLSKDRKEMCVSISKRCLVWEQGAAVGLEANWMCPESRPKHQSPHKRARGCVCVSGFMQTSLVQVGKAQFLCEKCNLVFLSLPAGTCHFRLCPNTPFLKYYPFYILPIPPTLSHTACFVPICKTQDSPRKTGNHGANGVTQTCWLHSLRDSVLWPTCRNLYIDTTELCFYKYLRKK